MQITITLLAILTKTPVLLWGAPGIGKSSVLSAIFEALGWPLEIILAAIRDPTDFGGFPVATQQGDTTVMSMLPTAWAQRLSERLIGNRPAGLFLEEINQAPPSVQAALMRVVLDRYVGDVKLGPNVACIAAANPPEQSAGGFTLAPPLANRFAHVDWSMTADYWANGLVAGFPAPSVFHLQKDWEANYLPDIVGLIGAYAKSHSAAMQDVPKDESKAGRAWPSYRSWTTGARMLAAAVSQGMGDGVQAAALSSCVGPDGALMFMEYKAKMDLPTAEEMLANPKKVKFPTNRGDKVFAMLATAAAYAIAKKESKIWLKALELCKCAADTHKDVAAVAATQLAKHMPDKMPIPEALLVFYEAYQKAGLCK